MVDIIPGLKGFGTTTRAAYDAANPPEICVVDELGTATGPPSWDSAYGVNNIGVFKGTLIQCLEGVDTLNGETIDGHVVAANSGKIVLFETSGTIHQTGADGANTTFQYEIGNYTTMAGQTSPNPGILLRNICIWGTSKHDILIQHLRGRMDGPPSMKFTVHKSFQFPAYSPNPTHHIVLDHVSAAWGADANIEFWKSSTGGELHDVTIANCIMAESRENMGLIDEEPSNGKNLLIGGHGGGADTSPDILVYRNLFSNTKKRNPRIRQVGAAFVNNYMYNNNEFSVQLIADDGPVTLSAVGNVVDAGPMSVGSTTINQMINTSFNPWQTPISQNAVYLYDNKTEAGTQANSSDWSMLDVKAANTTLYADGPDYPNVKVTGENPSSDAPIWPTGLTLMSSSAVKDHIIANAGAYPAFRDSLDTRFINEMVTGTGPSSRVNGAPASGDWPVLDVNVSTLNIPANPHVDSGDGYTNLEKWLHGLADEVEGKTGSPYARSRGILRQKPRYNTVGGRF